MDVAGKTCLFGPSVQVPVTARRVPPTVALDAWPLVVGRGEGAHIMLDSPRYPCSLSRAHARLVYDVAAATWHRP